MQVAMLIQIFCKKKKKKIKDQDLQLHIIPNAST